MSVAPYGTLFVTCAQMRNPYAGRMFLPAAQPGPKPMKYGTFWKMRHEHGENEKIFSFQLLALAMG